MNISPAQKQAIITAIVAFTFALLAAFGYDNTVVQPREAAANPAIQPAAPAGGVGVQSLQPGLTYKNLTTRDFYISNGTTTLNGAATINNSLSVTGTLAGSAFLVFTPQATLVVTEAGVFTPTGTMQPISAVAAVTPTLSTIGFAAGAQLQLVNVGTNAIRILDGTPAALNASATLGISDTLRLVFYGGQWLAVSASDN